MKSFSFTLIFKLVIAASMFVLVSCSKDETVDIEIEESGNLEVTVQVSKDSPEPNAIVTLLKTEESKKTNTNGVVTFTDLSIGNYDVLVEIDENSQNYTEGIIYSYESAIVTADATTSIEIIILKGADPIGVSEVEIDSILEFLYNRLKLIYTTKFGDLNLIWGDLGTGTITYKNTYNQVLEEVDSFQLTPYNTLVEEVWTNHYQFMYQINQTLKTVIDNNYYSESGKQTPAILADLRFMRSLVYSNLLVLYGNPVLVTEDTTVEGPFVNDRDGIKDLIISDLNFVISSLEEGNNGKYVANVNAAKLLLAKHYLNVAGFPDFETDKLTDAKSLLVDLLPNVILEDEYRDIFGTSNIQSDEVLFAVNVDVNSDLGGRSVGVIYGPLGYTNLDAIEITSGYISDYFIEGSSPANPVSFPLEISDKRFNENIATFKIENDTQVNSENTNDWRPLKNIKNFVSTPTYNSSDMDLIILRSADVLLTYAEVENSLNGPSQSAYDALQKLISRSVTEPSAILQAGLTQEAFLNEILKQRRLEFSFEGAYKSDLIRNGLLQEVINAFNNNYPERAKQYQSHEYIWPIPQIEIDYNPDIIQNPGY